MIVSLPSITGPLRVLSILYRKFQSLSTTRLEDLLSLEKSVGFYVGP